MEPDFCFAINADSMPEPMPEDTEDAKQAIRSAGLRVTPARLATVNLLKNAAFPMTHASVAEILEPIGIDQATVFRNLNDLANVGLLRKTELGDHLWRFEWANQPGRDPAHPHFICIDCGSVACLDDVKLTAKSLRLSENIGEVTEILLRGYCRDCN